MSKISDYVELDEITHTLERPDVYMGALNNVRKDFYTYRAYPHTLNCRAVCVSALSPHA